MSRDTEPSVYRYRTEVGGCVTHSVPPPPHQPAGHLGVQEAGRQLARNGAPPRDWAGFVLTGVSHEPVVYLVAVDGVLYRGIGYSPELIRRIPFLDGVRLSRRGDTFAPLPRLDDVASLFSLAEQAHGNGRVNLLVNGYPRNSSALP